MNEKYHVLEEDKKCYSDIWVGYNALINNEVVGLLNKQEERIKELEIELNTYKRKFLDCVDRKMSGVK